MNGQIADIPVTTALQSSFSSNVVTALLARSLRFRSGRRENLVRLTGNYGTTETGTVILSR